MGYLAMTDGDIIKALHELNIHEDAQRILRILKNAQNKLSFIERVRQMIESNRESIKTRSERLKKWLASHD